MSLKEDAAQLATRLDAEARTRRRDTKHSRRERVRTDLSTVGRFAWQVTVALRWLYCHVIRRALRLFRKPLYVLIRWYKALWAFVVYQRDPDGELIFSRSRAGLFLFASILFLWFLLIPLIKATFDLALYAVTAKNDEIVYLLGSQEIDSNTGAHIIEGCTALPCSDRDAIYFRTTDTLFNNLWSIAHGHGFFYPEYVGAAVPYSTSRCTVTSYGFRFRFPFRLFNVYSDMLAVTCRPIVTQ